MHLKHDNPRLIDSVQATAGLDLGEVTAEELTLSILAQLVKARRSDVSESDT